MMSNTAPSSFFTFSNTINGKSRAAAKETQAINPSNRQRLWQVPVASEEDVDEAVTAATEAFPTWSTTPWQDRAQRLTQAREALVKIHHDMASLIMQENGKPVGNRLRDSCQDMQAKMVL
jgi:acyl-CoA reductase-like NAD-dependent aldehyde dehydrogenase